MRQPLLRRVLHDLPDVVDLGKLDQLVGYRSLPVFFCFGTTFDSMVFATLSGIVRSKLDFCRCYRVLLLCVLASSAVQRGGGTRREPVVDVRRQLLQPADRQLERFGEKGQRLHLGRHLPRLRSTGRRHRRHLRRAVDQVRRPIPD